MFKSQSFGRIFWVDDSDDFKSCPQNIDGTGDFDCEEDYNQADCETTDGIYEEETYTYEVSITGNALTVTERSNDPDDAMCYCEDDEGNDIDGCDWDETDEAACTAAGGDYDNGEECSVWTFTKN